MKQLVVVGNGMAGVACVEQILKRQHEFEITIFGDEPHVNYNRILLSMVLAGEKSADDIVLNDIDWYKNNGIRTKLGVRIANIDRAARVVIDGEGHVTPFDELILATGSSAFIPPIPGVEKKNVHVFRTLDDTRALLDKSHKGCKAVVIGGGLLGLEAARGLQLRGCDVRVVHLMDTLMERQLDKDGGIYLLRKIESLGIRVMLPKQTQALLGNGRVEGLRFVCGEEVEADLVVIAAGIKPNAELARQAKLDVRRGIVVNDLMETSDPNIHAVGECTEHRGQTFGLVAPLMDQAKVLASAITGNRSTAFTGANSAAKLKIMGVEIFSAGSIDDTEAGIETVRYEDAALGIYKRLFLKDNRLRGVILVGDIADERRYTEWLRENTDLTPHRRHLLFPPVVEDAGLEVAAMAESEIVCGCNGVSKGTIIGAIHEHGITTLSKLNDALGRRPVVEAAPDCASNCCARWCRSSRKRRGPRCVPASRSPMSNCATSCAGSS